MVGATMITVAVIPTGTDATAIDSGGQTRTPLPATACLGQLQGQQPPASPTSVAPGIPLTPAERRTLRYWDFAGESVLSPRAGRRCAGTGGSNGVQVWAWNPRAGTRRGFKGSTPARIENEIVYAYNATIGPWAYRLACPWFPAADRKVSQLGETCHVGQTPDGTGVARQGSYAKRISIPARRPAYGTTSYAGGPNAAVLQVWWIPRTKFGDAGAAHAVCVLPPRRAPMCNTILNDYGARLLARNGVP
jgi:hypothetical protein